MSIDRRLSRLESRRPPIEKWTRQQRLIRLLEILLLACSPGTPTAAATADKLRRARAGQYTPDDARGFVSAIAEMRRKQLLVQETSHVQN